LYAAKAAVNEKKLNNKFNGFADEIRGKIRKVDGELAKAFQQTPA